MAEHTAECQERTRKLERARDGWIQKWPDYCKACNGWGGAGYSYDPSPAGVSLGSGMLEDFDTCQCTDNGICARCAGAVDDDGSCPHCGAEVLADGMPSVDDYCGCWWLEESTIVIPPDLFDEP